jgi:hypothetical protein
LAVACPLQREERAEHRLPLGRAREANLCLCRLGRCRQEKAPLGERDGASRLSETGTAGPAERVAVRRASLVRRSTRVEAVCFTVRATHSVPAVLCAALIHHCTGKLQSGSWFALSCDLVWTGRKTRVLGACVSGKLVPLDRTYGTAFR